MIANLCSISKKQHHIFHCTKTTNYWSFHWHDKIWLDLATERNLEAILLIFVCIIIVGIPVGIQNIQRFGFSPNWRLPAKLPNCTSTFINKLNFQFIYFFFEIYKDPSILTIIWTYVQQYGKYRKTFFSSNLPIRPYYWITLRSKITWPHLFFTVGQTSLHIF